MKKQLVGFSLLAFLIAGCSYEEEFHLVSDDGSAFEVTAQVDGEWYHWSADLGPNVDGLALRVHNLETGERENLTFVFDQRSHDRRRYRINVLAEEDRWVRLVGELTARYEGGRGYHISGPMTLRRNGQHWMKIQISHHMN
jgi:hypothetical protein